MVTSAKRKSNNAWDKANMTALGCKVRKDYADRDALDKYLEEHEERKS